MCLILLAYRTHPRYPLIIAANRDEFFDRPTAPASFWDSAPELLAGKDLHGGGTWLGITRSGRFAAVVNYRDPRSMKSDAPSRGSLVIAFLLGSISPTQYLDILQQHGKKYNGFSILFSDFKQLFCFSNRGDMPPVVQPGVHGLSNHLLDTPWPKVARGRYALEHLLAKDEDPYHEELFTLLADRAPAEDMLLPDTGIGLELERMLSPLFISGPGYGTRSSTLVLVDQESNVTFLERSFNGNPCHGSTVTFRFRLLDSTP